MSPITFAHRGGAADRPENTIAAFAHAVEHGVTGVEGDVRLSSDGVPVLAHDASLRRGLRRRRVDATTAADLSAMDVPSLRDLYEVVGTDVHVSLDLKTADVAGPALEVAGSAGVLERLWLCSPDLDALELLRSQNEAVRLVHSTTRTAVGDGLERHASRLSEMRIDAFNLHRTEWTRGLVVLFHRFDVCAFAWDVQEVRHLRAVLECGVDAVYSDHVSRMVGVVAEFAADG